MKDIQIINTEKTVVQPQLLCVTTDKKLRIYQKILVLLLSNTNNIYRYQQGTQITQLLQGANIPSVDFLLHLGQTACSQVLSQLDIQDRKYIKSLKAEVDGGNLFISLTVQNNETIKGIIA